MKNTSCWTWLQLDRIGLSLDYHGLRHMTQLFNGALVTFNSTRHTVISTVYHSHMMYLPGHLSSPLLMWMSRSPLCEIHLMHNSLLAAHRTAQVGTSIPRRTHNSSWPACSYRHWCHPAVTSQDLWSNCTTEWLGLETGYYHRSWSYRPRLHW